MSNDNSRHTKAGKIERIIALTEQFVSDDKLHNSLSLQTLMRERKKLIAGAASEDFEGLERELKEACRARLAECDEKLEVIIQRLKNSITASAGALKRTRTVFRKYKSRRPKPSLFIDNKR